MQRKQHVRNKKKSGTEPDKVLRDEAKVRNRDEDAQTATKSSGKTESKENLPTSTKALGIQTWIHGNGKNNN